MKTDLVVANNLKQNSIRFGVHAVLARAPLAGSCGGVTLSRPFSFLISGRLWCGVVFFAPHYICNCGRIHIEVPLGILVAVGIATWPPFYWAQHRPHCPHCHPLGVRAGACLSRSKTTPGSQGPPTIGAQVCAQRA